MITDGITINGKHSYRDYDLCIAERHIGIPPKKILRETIPYSNYAYDFTNLAGAPTYEQRDISYAFDIVGATAAEMEMIKADVLQWLDSVYDTDIYDDDIIGYHLHGSYNGAEWAEDDAQGKITVKFACYPFLIANRPTTALFKEPNSAKTISNIGRAVKAYANAPTGAVIAMLGTMQSVTGIAALYTAIDSGNTAVTVTINDGITTPWQQDTRTVNGITFTVDQAARTVTATGTATEDAYLFIKTSSSAFNLPRAGYNASGCPQGGSASTYSLRWWVNGAYRRDYGGGLSFEVENPAENIGIGVEIRHGVTVNGLVFTPRLYGETTIYFNVEVI